MKKILISFADSRYKESLEAIEANTKSFAFDERYFLTERNYILKIILIIKQFMNLWQEVAIPKVAYGQKIVKTKYLLLMTHCILYLTLWIILC